MSTAAELSADALQIIVDEAAGATPVCIQDLAVRTFGEDRVRAFLSGRRRAHDDPELAEFIRDVHALADASWSRRGVSALVGPYLK